ncbi:hypothetical protein [uncultured Mucilaginibacter sp.]|uniref:hypothetical protein n=1 Tax=uncultured Mucilaginibacter sp. TaxID=797541 RepID=UPI0025FA457A|nr:hypothetical protein [uncultured Mucilaginibacter sp.]
MKNLIKEFKTIPTGIERGQLTAKQAFVILVLTVIIVLTAVYVIAPLIINHKIK